MKLLAAVESCVAHEPRHAVILDTWGEQIMPHMDLVFFTGPMLSVPDDYDSLYLKTKAICRWAAKHDYDYLCKLDTDTYVHAGRLLASGFERYDYSGYVRPHFEPHYAYGPCYWLSRTAYTLVGESQAVGPYEDLLVGEILLKHGITPHHDERYSHWFPVDADNDRIIEHFNSTGGYTDERMRKSHASAYRIGPKVSNGQGFLLR